MAEIAREQVVIEGENDVATAVNEARAQVREGMSDIDRMKAEAEVNIKTAEAMAELDRVEAKMKRMAAMKAEGRVDINDDGFNRTFAALEAKKQVLEREINIPVNINERSLNRGRSAFRGLTQDMDDSGNTLGNWFRSLSKVRVQMGFLSGTLRQVGIGFTLLGPIIMHLVGGAASLVGVLGTGLLGAFAVSGAAVAGFGITVAGLLPSLKQLFTELKTAPSVIGPLNQMRDTLTGDIRDDFFQMAHQGVKTLQSDFPVFRQGATAAFGAAEQGWRKWMEGLRSKEAKGVLDNILSGFTKSIPGLMAGLGSLGAAMGRVFGSAAKFLPSLSGGFANWANNLEQSIGSGNELDQKIGRLIGHMRDLGHLAQASGSFLVTFFGASADSGDDLVKSLTKNINGWNKFMKTVQGQKQLQDFFKDSAEGTKNFFSVLASAGQLLFQFSRAMQPISDAALQIVTLLGDVTQAVMGFGPAAAVVTKLAQAFVALKIATAFLGAFGVKTGGVGGLLGSLFGRGGAKGVGTEMTTVATRGSALGTTLGRLAGPVGIAALAMVALGAASEKVTTQADRAVAAHEHFNQAATALPPAIKAATQAQQDSAGAWQRVNRLEEQGKTNTKAYTQAVREGARADDRAAQTKAQVAGERRKLSASIEDERDRLDRATEAQQHNIGAARAGPHAIQALNAEHAKLAANLRLDTLNYNRLGEGLKPVNAGMLKSLGTIKQLGGRQTALKFRFDDQSVVSGLARTSQKLKGLGAGRQAVKILADTGSAESKLSRLRGLLNRVKDTKRIVASVTDQASGKVATIKSKIDALKDKVVNMRANDQSSAKIRAIEAAIAALHDKQVTITTYYRTRGNPQYGTPAGGPHAYAGAANPAYQSIQGFQRGGMTDRAMADAYRKADHTSPLDPRGGGKINKPRYIAGEQAPHYDEYIITENPAFRASNMGFLAMAATALGALLIPGHFSGAKKAGKNKKKDSKGVPGATLDKATDSTSQYAFWSNQVQYDADIVSLWTRYMEAGSKTVDDVRGKIGIEIGSYGQLAKSIQDILGSRAIMDIIPNKAKPKKLSAKAQEKHPRKAEKVQRQRDQIDEHNRSAREGKGDLESELAGILDSIIPGLWLDYDQVKNQAESLAFQNIETAGGLRQQVFQQYAGNLPTGGLTGLAVPPGGLAGSTTVAALGSTAGSLAVPSAPSGSLGGGVESAAGTTVSINQTFAAPPPDPHTYAQNVAFEIGAAV